MTYKLKRNDNQINIDVKILENGQGLTLPDYATDDSAGVDLLAAINEDIILKAGEYQIVPTGIAVALPHEFEMQVRPRSGLAAKHGITILNSPGTIDADYRGEIKAILINHGKEDFTISRGMRIAQAVFAPVTQGLWHVVHELDDTKRGSGGFGSTGL